MMKSVLAVALSGACAGAAHGQSALQIHGHLDAGTGKRSGQDVRIGERAANTLGLRGAEDLGKGFKALFHLDMRDDPDTGSSETGPGGNGREAFQGQSRLGLQGGFGTLRIGRALTPFHETIGNFEPFHAIPTAAGFYADPSVAIIGRGGAGAPQYPAGADASANPYSVSATCTDCPAALMAAYERNAIASKVWSVGASVQATPELKLMGTFTRLDEDHTRLFDTDTRPWVLGANYSLGPGRLLAGYGQKDSDGREKVRQMSPGHEYSLSKRTHLYIGASRKRGLSPGPATVNQYDTGINHTF